MAFSGISCAIFIYLLPESPAWLISMNRLDKTDHILKKIAKINGIQNYETTTLTTDVNQLLEKSSPNDLLTEGYNWREFKFLVSPVKNLIQSCILLYIWAAITLMLYSQSFGMLDSDLINPYVMYFMTVVAGTVGYTICFLNDYIGPKKLMAAFFVANSVIYTTIVLITMNDSQELVVEKTMSIRTLILLILGLLGRCMTNGNHQM